MVVEIRLRRGALWRKVVSSIRNEDLASLPSCSQAQVPGPWREIKRLPSTPQTMTTVFFEQIASEGGKWQWVRFWEDPRTQIAPLKSLFPNLYQVSSQRQVDIARMGWFECQTWRWTLLWRRQLTPLELQQAEELNTPLSRNVPSGEQAIQILWVGKDKFTIKQLEQKENDVLLQEAAVDSVVCSSWMNLTPPQVEFWLWLGLLGKLNTKELLVKRGILPSEANICSFCSSHGGAASQMTLHRMSQELIHLGSFWINGYLRLLEIKQERRSNSLHSLLWRGAYGWQGMGLVA